MVTPAHEDAQYLNDEVGSPADSTRAAHCNYWDFGMSRWQLCNNSYPNTPCCCKGLRFSLLSEARVKRVRPANPVVAGLVPAIHGFMVRSAASRGRPGQAQARRSEWSARHVPHR